jgi:hypothetical protein
MLTAERLRELLHYDPETGVFTWVARPRSGPSRVGQRAGGAERDGYVRLKVDGGRYSAHRLAWLYVTGAWPVAEVDHINGVRGDNRFSNLREATIWQNKANQKRHSDNAAGFKGVVWSAYGWKAQIARGGRQIYLGLFKTPEEAHAAYIGAAQVIDGEFARTE